MARHTQVHSSRSFAAARREVCALFGAPPAAGDNVAAAADDAADAAATTAAASTAFVDPASGVALTTSTHTVAAGVQFVRGGGERGAGGPGVVPAPGLLLAVGSLNETICCVVHPRLLRGAAATGSARLPMVPGLTRVACSGTLGGTADLATVFEAFARHGFVPVALRQVALSLAQAAAFVALGGESGASGAEGQGKAAALCEGGGACVAVALQRDSAVARAAAMIGGAAGASRVARSYGGGSAFGSSGGAAPIEPALAACMSVSKSATAARLELCWFFDALHNSVDAIRAPDEPPAAAADTAPAANS